jgi:hypothetical protein
MLMVATYLVVTISPNPFGVERKVVKKKNCRYGIVSLLLRCNSEANM